MATIQLLFMIYLFFAIDESLCESIVNLFSSESIVKEKYSSIG